MSAQNRLIRIAGGLLITLSLLGCSPSEKSAGPPQHNNRAIVILLTICPGASVVYKSPSSNVVITNTPSIPPPPDKIGLDPKTGDLDLTSLVVAKHSGHDHSSRHVDITYALETPCPSDKQYSFYFQHDPKPFKRKDGDDTLNQLNPHSFDDGATSVLLYYRNDGNEKEFAFHINYTVVKTDSGGGETTSKETTPDPNIKNTPVQ